MRAKESPNCRLSLLLARLNFRLYRFGIRPADYGWCVHQLKGWLGKSCFPPMAANVGFEPTDRSRSPVFKTVAIILSANSPYVTKGGIRTHNAALPLSSLDFWASLPVVIPWYKNMGNILRLRPPEAISGGRPDGCFCYL